MISSEAISRRRFFSRALRDCQAMPPSLSSCASLSSAPKRVRELDVLDRQIERVAARVLELEAVVRRAQRRDRLQAGEAADAVVGVDDEIADGKARRLGQNVGGAARLAARAHEAVAEDVLLGDDGEFGCLEALLEAEHGKRGDAAGKRQRLGEALDLRLVLEPVVGKQRGQALARAGRPGGDDGATSLLAKALHVARYGIEQIGVRVVALGREGAAARVRATR